LAKSWASASFSWPLRYGHTFGRENVNPENLLCDKGAIRSECNRLLTTTMDKMDVPPFIAAGRVLRSHARPSATCHSLSSAQLECAHRPLHQRWSLGRCLHTLWPPTEQVSFSRFLYGALALLLLQGFHILRKIVNPKFHVSFLL